MKKIYLLAFSVLLAGGSFAQTAKKKASNPVRFGQSSSAKLKNTKPNNTQAIVWSDTFADATKWDVTDSTATSQAWVIGTATAWGGAATMGSTTAADGYALFDSDGYGNGTTNNCTMVNSGTNPIDLTGHPNVKLVFEEHYMMYFDQVMVYVSGDGGTTWTGFDPHPGLAQDVEIGDPTAVLNTINISAVAGNSNNVKVAFNYKGAWDYWWFVDDVRIEDLPADDGAITSVTLPSDGCGLSASQMISATVSNVGTADIVNPDLRLYVDGALIATETYTGTILVGSSTNYTFTATANLSSVMTHSVAAVLVAANDADAANDSTEAVVETFPTFTAPYANSFEGGVDFTNLLIYNVLGASNWGLDNTFPNTGAQDLIVFEGDAGGNPVAGVSDQWLVTNCFQLNAGTSYTVKYFGQGITGFGGELSISYGSTNNPAGMTNLIKPLTAPSMGAYTADSASFTPSASGIYYFGFRVFQADPAGNTVYHFR
jgi:hypothetical protein